MPSLQKIETSCDNCQKSFILVITNDDVEDAHYCPFCGEHAYEIEGEDQ